jgi:hypothetical protein
MEVGRVRRHRALRDPQPQRERYESLLCSVMQVAFDPAARVVRRGDGPHAGGREPITALRCSDRPKHLEQPEPKRSG